MVTPEELQTLEDIKRNCEALTAELKAVCIIPNITYLIYIDKSINGLTISLVAKQYTLWRPIKHSTGMDIYWLLLLIILI